MTPNDCGRHLPLPPVFRKNSPLAVLSAGKEVLVEKPLHRWRARLEGGRRVAEAACANGRVLVVGHLLESQGRFRANPEQGFSSRYRRIEAIASFAGRSETTEEATGLAQPFVSVVIPIRNEARSVARTLAAVLAQDYPSDRLEVIIADGMSTDGTRVEIDRAVAAAGASAPPVTVIDNPRRIVSTGLNAAIAKAGGEVIVRVDGHCEPARDYVRRCLEALEATDADNVGGVVAAKGHTAMAIAIAAAVSSRFGVGNARFRYGGEPGWVDTVPFGTWRRELFNRIGGFDEELVRNQDDELNFRLIQAGGRIWLDPTIRVAYESRDSLAALWRQYFRYGLYKVRVMQKRRAVASVRQLVPAAFVTALAASAALSVATRRPRWLVAALLPYSVGLAAATAATRPGDVYVAMRVPAAFATLHLSYGAGFLAGLWRWRRHFCPQARSASSRPPANRATENTARGQPASLFRSRRRLHFFRLD